MCAQKRRTDDDIARENKGKKSDFNGAKIVEQRETRCEIDNYLFASSSHELFSTFMSFDYVCISSEKFFLLIFAGVVYLSWYWCMLFSCSIIRSNSVSQFGQDCNV